MADLKQQAIEVVATLRDHGHKAYFAGGCVRDMLMGRRPADYDIATSARPEEVTQLFRKTVQVGAQFGVVCVIIDSHAFEVATFRTETGYTDHRHPDIVEYSDAEGDVRRRDFTINALLYDPLTNDLLDYVGGENDIKAGVIRTVGDPEDRIEEDYLRMLRAVRFAARFDYEIAPDTIQAIVRNSAQILHVSWERIGAEILKIFGGHNPHVGLQLLADSKLLEHVLPEVDDMIGVEQPSNFHPEGDVFQHTLLALSKIEEPRSPEFGMAVLLHDVGKPPTFVVADRIRFNHHCRVGAELSEKIGRRLRFSNDQISYIRKLVKKHMQFMHVFDMRESTLKRFLREPDFDDLLELHRLDTLSSHGDLRSYHFCKQKIAEFGKEKIEPPRLLTGSDLIDLGYQPGPMFREILSAVEDAQLEGTISTKEEAIELVERQFPQRLHD